MNHSQPPLAWHGDATGAVDVVALVSNVAEATLAIHQQLGILRAW